MPETGIVCAGRRGNMMGNGAARLFAPRKATLFFCRNIYTRGVFRRLRSEGGWGRAESPQCARRRNPLPRWGLTRRFRRGRRACSPMGRSHFSFDGERKVCKRKPAARRLREKALYCPFWRRGSLCRAQRSWPATPAIVRARSSPFSAVKMGGPFSLRCLSPLCSPAVGGGQACPLRGGKVSCRLTV